MDGKKTTLVSLRAFLFVAVGVAAVTAILAGVVPGNVLVAVVFGLGAVVIVLAIYNLNSLTGLSDRPPND